MAKGKKKRTKRIKKGYQYAVSGDELQRKKTPCPKCGPGVFMAEHKNRSHCGKCGYTMMKGAKPAEPEPEAQAPEGN